MGKKLKAPPRLNEGTSYKVWKDEVEMWKIVCGYEKKEQAIVLRLESFENNSLAKRCVENLKITDLNEDEGVTTLLGKLDETFQQDKTDEQYFNYLNFQRFRKRDNQNMVEYISEFEHLYYKMVGDNEGMKLADNILAYALIDYAKVTEDERKMVFSALGGAVTYKLMKSSMKRIFSNHSESLPGSNTAIKQEEEAYYTRRNYYSQNTNNGKYNNFRGQRNVRFAKPYNQSNPPTKRLQLRVPNKPGPSSSNVWNRPQYDGSISRCIDCGSKKHWVDVCPHVDDPKTALMVDEFSELANESDQDNVVESANIVLMIDEVANTDIDKHEILVTETSNAATVDTACSRTVCGVKWWENWYAHLSDAHKRLIIRTPSNAVFRFGDGRKVNAIEKMTFPICIAGVSCSIEAELVPENIPLLLSKSSLKKAGTRIDIGKDECKMFDRDVKLFLTTAGHYCIDISPEPSSVKFDTNVCVDEVLFLESTLSKRERKTQILKIHKQFGHASAYNMKKIIKDAGFMDSEIDALVDEVIKECSSCSAYSKPPPKPIVGFTRSDEFNGCVAMDLHQLEPNVWYIHFIDEFSRYSAAFVIRKKSISALVFLRCWISVFGPPSKIFSDNGGEFIADDFYNLCETFNIEVSTSPSHAPWSNGTVERHNQTLTNIILKLKDDIGCAWEVAVAWAVSAKNALANHNGFSPAQLVFGRNGNFPSTLNDKLPALDKQSDTSAAIGLHIAALHAARQEFIACESSEKIRRALRKQTRSFDHKYQMGEKVWYKRDDQKRWCGPAKVLGQDGPVLFLRQGTRSIKAHTYRVTPVLPSEHDVSTEPQRNQITTNNNTFADAPQELESSDDENDVLVEPALPSETVRPSSPASTPAFDFDVSKLKSNQRISYSATSDGQDTTRFAKIIGNAGKKSGPHRNWYNIQFEDPDASPGDKVSVDLSTVPNLVLLDSLPVQVNNADGDEVLEVAADVFDVAKHKELQSWQENEVYDVVKYQGQKCISVRWVCCMKDTGDGTLKPKARLVARGFEENDRNIEKDSPTVGKDSLRVMLSTVTDKQWKLRSIDIKTAFLQGEHIKRPVFLKPPAEANCPMKHVWMLKKCVYGLSDASLRWYSRVKSFMLSVGGKMSKLDPALFIWHNGSSLLGLIAVHVDDLLCAGTKDFESTVLAKLRATFQIGREESSCFQYLGINLQQIGCEVILDQKSYIYSLSPIDYDRNEEDNLDAPVSENMRKVLQCKIGQILWVCNQTRPDVCYDVSYLSTNLSKATIRDVLMINRTIRKLKRQDIKLTFKPLNADKKLIAFTDASLGGLPNGGSQCGSLVFLVDSAGNCNLLSWSSKQIKRVVRSSLSAETLGMSECLDSVIFVKMLYRDMNFGDANKGEIDVTLFTDSKSLIDGIKSNKPVNEKRLRFDVNSVKEAVQNHQIQSVQWIDTKRQLADMLTKQGSSCHGFYTVVMKGKLQL